MPPKKDNKPKGPMNSYSAFVQVCREEHRKKHPEDVIVFADFSRKCGERWKSMKDGEKRRFEDIAAKDKARYQREMATHVPAPTGNKRKQVKKKDPDAPKRALSAFFHFCGEHRAAVKEKHPSYSVGDIAKELGAQWEKVKGEKREKYDQLAAEDKKRYEKEMAIYKGKKPKLDAPESDGSEESD